MSKKEDFFNAFFDKLAGGNTLRLSIIDGKSESRILDKAGLKNY